MIMVIMESYNTGIRHTAILLAIFLQNVTILLPYTKWSFMSMKPLTELISGLGFDKYQPGLTSRFAAYRFAYKLTYCEPTDNTAMRLDFESPLHLGRVTAWE